GSVLEDSSNGAAPGTVVEIVPSRGIAVTAGEGMLLLTRVQSADGVAEPARAWAVRRGFGPGARLCKYWSRAAPGPSARTWPRRGSIEVMTSPCSTPPATSRSGTCA